MTASKIINPIHVREGEYVDIHWHLRNGKIHVERRECPSFVILIDEPGDVQDSKKEEKSEEKK